MITLVFSSFPPSSNRANFNRPKGQKGKGRINTKEYTSWKESAGWELVAQKPMKLKGWVNITLAFADAGNEDLDNLSKAPIDLLVTHGVIEQDSRQYVRRIEKYWSPVVKSGFRMYVAPEMPE